MEWLVGKPNEALQVVFRAAGVHGQGGVVALCAKRNLEDALRAAEGWTLREPWIKLRALLDLLLGSSPADALEVFDKHISETSSGTVAHESLTVASLLTIFRHTVVLRNPSPPALLRDRAQKAVETYPSNSVLVGLFLESEKGHGVWGRVRGTLGESGGKDKDVARRVEEVWIAGWEKGRWEAEIERTRSGLTGAIESERFVLWSSFMSCFSQQPPTELEAALSYGGYSSSSRFVLVSFSARRRCCIGRLVIARSARVRYLRAQVDSD